MYASPAVVAIVHGLGDADPDIQQPQTGDDTAHRPLCRMVASVGCEDEEILVQMRGHLGAHHQHAHINAEQHKHKSDSGSQTGAHPYAPPLEMATHSVIRNPLWEKLWLA